ncbi:metal-sensing transcriptional repressor [Inquilinus limosus]|uniref:metal-sensing transcriptional repressor n=1 Tax=Inquilinus limosus TaxID=171674 RepID=UPI00040EB275|nr:metal-sensing transcriptional repressor [Inquilinus limosus]
MSHANNPEILGRLKRAQGHLAATLRMVEAGEDGLAIAQQLQAVIKAVEKAKTMLILDHVDHCVAHLSNGSAEGRETHLASLREITKYL